MQTLAEVTFDLALVLPPLALLVAATVLFASSFIGWRSDVRHPRVSETQSMAVHHRVAH